MKELRETIKDLRKRARQYRHISRRDFAEDIVAGFETVDGRLNALEQRLLRYPPPRTIHKVKALPPREQLERKANELLKIAPGISDPTLRERVARLAKGILADLDGVWIECEKNTKSESSQATADEDLKLRTR